MSTVCTLKTPDLQAVAGVVCARHPHLALVEIPEKGRGVIATAFIPVGTVLEIAPVVRLTEQDAKALAPTLLNYYIFEWDEKAGRDSTGKAALPYAFAFVLGVTSLINHSSRPNVQFSTDYAGGMGLITATRNIQSGEEILQDYDCELWFEPSDEAIAVLGTDRVLQACPLHSALAVAEFPGKGRGVVATEFLPAGTLLELSPVLPLLPEDHAPLEPVESLYTQTFDWPVGNYDAAIVLGLLPLINHAARSNADFHPDFAARTMRVVAIRDIEAGEEITIDYGCELWFEVKE